MQPITIIGSGMAAYTLAREIRKLNQDIALRLISDDNADFYSKPMLSNALNAGKQAWQLAMKDRVAMGLELNAEIIPNCRVNRINRNEQCIETDNGNYTYSQLVLAVGAQQIRIPMEGSGAGKVLTVNHLNDYARFRDAIRETQRVLIIGAGLIGCEFANDLVLGGKMVTVVDLSARPLSRLMPEAAGHFLQTRLEGAGVQFRLENSISRIEDTPTGLSVSLAQGEVVEVDVVLSSIGLKPEVNLAREAGLETGQGIKVNRQLQTSDAHIFALGDCSEIEGMVLPYVLPIMQGAKALAATLTGTATAVQYPAMPVVVKTPACPAVIAVPASNTQYEMATENDETGMTVLYKAKETGLTIGFVLLGAHTSKRQSLAKELPMLLAN